MPMSQANQIVALLGAVLVALLAIQTCHSFFALWHSPLSKTTDGRLQDLRFDFTPSKNSNPQPSECFRAAVLEHAPFAPNYVPGTNIQSHVTEIIEKNLESFIEAIAKASADGADLIVLPEDALICASDYPRSALIDHALEEIPEAKDQLLCKENLKKKKSILQRIACSAKDHQIWVAFSFGDKVKCDTKSDHCPPDGYWLYNSVILIDSSGRLKAKYHKMQLFQEPQYNLPSESRLHSDPITFFESPFGRIGFAICIDLLYEKPIIPLVEKHKIDILIFPTYWYNEKPFFEAVQIQQATAITHNVTLIAANVNVPSEGSLGSGIYHANEGALVYTNRADKQSKILLANVPKGTAHRSTNCFPNAKSFRLEGQRGDDDDVRTAPMVREMNFEGHVWRRQLLRDKQDYIKHCSPDNATCCYLFYRVRQRHLDSFLRDNYVLLFGSSLMPTLGEVKNSLHFEFCSVVACSDEHCKHFREVTATPFSTFDLKVRFHSKYVFPSVMTTDGTRSRLLPVSDYNFVPATKKSTLPKVDEGQPEEWSMLAAHGMRRPLVSATLLGRRFDKDPIYKQ